MGKQGVPVSGNTPSFHRRPFMSRQDDALYRELVDHQQDLLVKFSPEGRLLFVNRAYCEAMGKTNEDLVGSVFMPTDDERYADALATKMTSLFRPPHTCIVEQWISSPKGPRCISWSARSVVDGNGNVASIVASGRDVTELKKARRTTTQRDSHLMFLIESGTPMYYTHSPDHTLLYVSPRIRAMLGYTQGTGKRAWTDFLTDHPFNAQGLERTLRAIASGRREPPYRLEMAKKDGSRIWVEVDEIPVVKSDKTIAIAGSLVDVTAKMKVEEGLAEAEILIKDYKGHNKGEADENGPLAALKSIFTPKKAKADDELPPDFPDGLK